MEKVNKYDRPHRFFVLLLLILLINVLVIPSSAQRIRTDHREMTPGQKIAYLAAVNMMANEINEMADDHAADFNTPIHSTSLLQGNGKQFLPWHRVHQFEMEEMLRSAGTTNSQYITIPYWDWTIENTASNVTWDDADFLSLSNISSELEVTRANPLGQLSGNPLATNPLATNTNLASLKDLTSLYSTSTPTPDDTDVTNSPFFSKRLEAWHNNGHVFVGVDFINNSFISRTMGGAFSPRDPVFFLHHGFVDKVWQDWEDQNNSIQSVFDYTSLLGDYSSINPNTIIDSRFSKYPITSTNILQEDVWYGFNKKLLLDGLGGNFNVTGTGRVYSYTPWNTATSSVEGVIYSGDVMRNASDNVVNDTKGGFVIKNGADCTFKAGKEVKLLPGFKVEAGANFVAKIVSTPHGFNSNTSGSRVRATSVTQSEQPIDKVTFAETKMRIYPNPFANEITVEYELTSESPVDMVIFNSLGQPVFQNQSGIKPLGRYAEKIYTQDFNQGLYILQLKTNEMNHKLKIIK
jgi:tyrosinase